MGRDRDGKNRRETEMKGKRVGETGSRGWGIEAERYGETDGKRDEQRKQSQRWGETQSNGGETTEIQQWRHREMGERN